MSLKEYKPTTSSQRGLVLVDKSDLYKGRPLKEKTKRVFSSGGRNNTGRITVRHHGGGNKRLYRIIDFKRHIHLGIEGSVLRLEYDPNRTSFIALIEYKDGKKEYIIAPQKLAVGDVVIASPDADIKPGNALPLVNIPVGTLVHNVEMKALKGGQLARSAGCYAQVLGKEGNYVQLCMSSGEKRVVRSECWATVGAVSNPDNMNQNFAKAGRMRWKGIRPTVRGVAMNPIDHPHGGGEGRTSGGRHPVTPWGVSTKGKKTRTNKSTDRYIISDRRKGR